MNDIDFSVFPTPYYTDPAAPLQYAPPVNGSGPRVVISDVGDMNDWLDSNRNLVYIAVGVALFLAMRS